MTTLNYYMIYDTDKSRYVVHKAPYLSRAGAIKSYMYLSLGFQRVTDDKGRSFTTLVKFKDQTRYEIHKMKLVRAP